MWLGFVHVGFTVSDLERSVAWYEEVLGLSLIRRQRNDNAYTRQIVGMPDAVLDVAFLGFPAASRSPGAQVVELMQYLAPPGASPELRTCDVGVGHLALAVEDLASEHARLRALGVRFRNPPAEIDEGLNRGSRACYLLDPDGITIELIQPPR